MGIGSNLGAFASGFQTSFNLKLLKKEKERQDKLVEEKEANAMNWYNSNKENLNNFQSQPQDIRNQLIFNSVIYSDDWHKYLADCEKAIQNNDLEELKHLNDMEEEKIKAETNMLSLGVRPENAFIGKYYSDEDLKYVKELNIGKVAGGKTAETMMGQTWKEQGFGEIPITPKTAGISDYNSATTYLSKFVNSPLDVFNKEKASIQNKFGIDVSNITQESLREPEKVSTLTANQFFKTPDEVIKKSSKVEGYRIDPTLDKEKGWYANYTPEPTGEKPNPNSYLFGKKDLYGNVQSMGIIPYATQLNISSGIPLTEEQKKEIINNHNIQKSLLDEDSLKQVELILKQLEINLEGTAFTPEPIPEPTPGPGPIQKGVNWIKGLYNQQKGYPVNNMQGSEINQGIPTPTMSTEQKGALISSLSKEELFKQMKGLDPSDPMYKLLYEEAKKRGYITE